MISPRLFVCSGTTLAADDPRIQNRKVVPLDALGPRANVNIKLEDLAKVFLEHLSIRLIDLLEVASYVYTADCETYRGDGWTDSNSTEPWSRDFRFIVPVRDIEFWNRNDVKSALTRCLSFMSDDIYEFDFELLKDNRPVQQYLEFTDQKDWLFDGVQRVFMFSGGLDSLAGAVEAASQGENIVLVSHRPKGTLSKRQKILFENLRKTFASKMIHIPVWINKEAALGKEHSQRTRSFLYSALGTTVAQSIHADGVSFFENGIVSLNLPVADEVLRARASRTTHPSGIQFLSDFYSLVTERKFVIDNPFLFKTKSEVVSLIAEKGAAALIGDTCSCAHTGFFQSKTQLHCGTCSQCIDRRIAIIAAGQEEHDPSTDYKVDVFEGSREKGYQQNMAVNYVRHALELDQMSEENIVSAFNPELSRAARSFPNRREAIEQYVSLHKRHAASVCSVIQGQIKTHAVHLIAGKLSNSSLLGLVAGQEHLKPAWAQFSDRIGEILKRGIPIACKTHKPRNETHLQEICDGILKGKESDLIREFPFMRWSSSMTKPDWSSEALSLWIELKYIRQKSDILPITEAIAADITKYGDNQKRALYVIYDPHHLITDEDAFSRPIISRESMFAHFIR